MAVSFGKLEEFDTASGDDWVQYIERMEHYFLANEITDASKQRSILISSMGGDIYVTTVSHSGTFYRLSLASPLKVYGKCALAN